MEGRESAAEGGGVKGGPKRVRLLDEEDSMADQRPTYWEALLAYLRGGATAILTWLRNLIGGR